MKGAMSCDLLGISFNGSTEPASFFGPPRFFPTAFDGDMHGLIACSTTSVGKKEVAQRNLRASPGPTQHSNDLCCLSRRDVSTNEATQRTPRACYVNLAASVRNQKKGRRVTSRVCWNDLHNSTMLVLMAAPKNACTITIVA